MSSWDRGWRLAKKKTYVLGPTRADALMSPVASPWRVPSLSSGISTREDCLSELGRRQMTEHQRRGYGGAAADGERDAMATCGGGSQGWQATGRGRARPWGEAAWRGCRPGCRGGVGERGSDSSGATLLARRRHPVSMRHRQPATARRRRYPGVSDDDRSTPPGER